MIGYVVLVGVVILIVVITVIGRINGRNVPEIMDNHDIEAPALDLQPIKAEIFDQLYYIVLVQHQDTGEEYLEARQRGNHRVVAIVDSNLQIELLQQQQQQKGK